MVRKQEDEFGEYFGKEYFVVGVDGYEVVIGDGKNYLEKQVWLCYLYILLFFLVSQFEIYEQGKWNDLVEVLVYYKMWNCGGVDVDVQ